MAISSPGIGSNLDVNGIVSKLMQVESQPLTTLARKESSYQAKLSAYGNLSGALSSFQSAMAGLSKPDMFGAQNAVVADPSVFKASAASGAVAGTYSVNVTQLAQAQTLAASGQASATAPIGSGDASISFQFGTITGGSLASGVYTGASYSQDASRPAGTVNIKSPATSLEDIRDAVNAADIGVTATIVSDGSAAPHRLVLTSAKTGASSSMKITVSGNTGIQALLSQDPAGTQNMTQGSAAQSTQLTVNGIAVTSQTDSVADAIQGVTLNVAKTGASTLTVSRNTAAVQTAVSGFVKAYNDLNATIKSLTDYNADTKVGGPLVGDSTARSIQVQVRRTLSASLAGLSATAMTLPQAGVSFQKDGTLALDATKLQSALDRNFSDVGALFATFGKASDSLVSFSSSTTATMAGSYPVTVTTLASQGQLTGSTDLRSANTTIADNTTLAVELDGASANVTLAAGSYTAAQLASLVQSAINGASTFTAAGSSVTATIDGNGYLKIASSRYGSASAVNIGSATGTPASTLFGATPAQATGVDVAGTIGGVAASGSGQTLTAATASPAQGLKLLVTGGAPGNRGTVDFSQGYADRLSKLMDEFLGSEGLIAGGRDGINRSIKDIDKARDALSLRLAQTEKRYRAQFTALDVAISSMTRTSSFLSQQLAQLNAE